MAATSAEQEVLAAQDLWKQAMMNRDVALFERVLHPALAFGHSSGLVQTRAQAIKQVVEQAASLAAIDFRDTQVNVEGTAATIIGKVDYLERTDGKDVTVNLMVLTAWVKGLAGWQMLARQAAKLPSPSLAK